MSTPQYHVGNVYCLVPERTILGGPAINKREITKNRPIKMTKFRSFYINLIYLHTDDRFCLDYFTWMHDLVLYNTS